MLLQRLSRRTTAYADEHHGVLMSFVKVYQRPRKQEFHWPNGNTNIENYFENPTEVVHRNHLRGMRLHSIRVGFKFEHTEDVHVTGFLSSIQFGLINRLKRKEYSPWMGQPPKQGLSEPIELTQRIAAVGVSSITWRTEQW